jgi:hypothetical protein
LQQTARIGHTEQEIAGHRMLVETLSIRARRQLTLSADSSRCSLLGQLDARVARISDGIGRNVALTVSRRGRINAINRIAARKFQKFHRYSTERADWLSVMMSLFVLLHFLAHLLRLKRDKCALV